MPELPEVEMMARKLRNWIAPNIEDVSVFRGEKYLPGDELETLRGARFGTSLGSIMERRGKYLLFHTDRGLLVCHNAMSGYWDALDDPWTFDYVEGKRTSTDKDVRVSITVVGGMDHGPSRVLRFHDARLFGSLRFYAGAPTWRHTPLYKLGPDALETAMLGDAPVWTAIDLWKSAQDHGGVIKQLLLDQRHVAGIGNIYAVEALHRARISPIRPSKLLDQGECAAIVYCARQIMHHAIQVGLRYDQYLDVYRQKNCGFCDTEITRVTVNGRPTFFCQNCQR